MYLFFLLVFSKALGLLELRAGDISFLGMGWDWVFLVKGVFCPFSLRRGVSGWPQGWGCSVTCVQA